MKLAILQARYSSSRLPGKVMKPLLGVPMLARQIERIRRARCIDRLMVATSTDVSDNVIVSLCNSLEVDCYRGSLDDVLDRYYQAALTYRPEHVIRLTGDCPLIDPLVIDAVVEQHVMNANDYTSNTQPPTFPDGLDVEVMRFATLHRAWHETTLPSQREHVTYYIYTTMPEVRIGQLQCAVDWSALRWTVDEPADFKFVEQVYASLYSKKSDFDMELILELLRQRPDLVAINQGIERNEGLFQSLGKDKNAI